MSRKRTILYTIIFTLILVLAGDISYLVRRHSATPVQNTAASKPVARAPVYSDKIGTADPGNTYKLIMDESRLISGPATIRVEQGASVRINITATEEESKLQLEGYDIISEATPQAPGAFSFIANEKGTFIIYALQEEEAAEDHAPAPTAISKVIVE